MMREGMSTTNIPNEAMEFFDNGRKRVQNVMKGVMNLILQGGKVELAYEKARENDTFYTTKLTIWADRITQFVEKANMYNNMVKNKYQDQIE